MGKPFGKELSLIPATLSWALTLDLALITEYFNSNSDKPYLIVGSGGSLSACHYAVGLLRQRGILAKAVTPLDILYSTAVLRTANILFISASGRNTDIQLAFKTAVQYDPASLAVLCMQVDSPLSRLANQYNVSYVFAFNQPAGKDGFLATNSLIAFFAILAKALDPNFTALEVAPPQNYHDFLSRVSGECTYTVLFGGWGEAAAVDLESKLTEAALGAVLLADYRNFGHGRHHWFAKQGSRSALIALVTPTEAELAEKTLAVLPSEIPMLRLVSAHAGAAAGLELLIHLFNFVQQLGIRQQIDPGRPGVPAYGSKLYNLRYSHLLATKLPTTADRAVRRKLQAAGYLGEVNHELQQQWHRHYTAFVTALGKAKFGSLILDYDGTLCPIHDKLAGVPIPIGDKLISLLESGITIAVATGRGQSVRQEMQRAIPAHLWQHVLIGYYNGSEIASLADNNRPNREAAVDEVIQEAYSLLAKQLPHQVALIEIRPHQLTIELREKSSWPLVRELIQQSIATSSLAGIQVVESSHSLDVISTRFASKRHMVTHCQVSARNAGRAEACLCIGDKGKWPGNDYDLLSTPFSLSADDVSTAEATCWNLAAAGLRHETATLYYLNHLLIQEGYFNYKA